MMSLEGAETFNLNSSASEKDRGGTAFCSPEAAVTGTWPHFFQCCICVDYAKPFNAELHTVSS